MCAGNTLVHHLGLLQCTYYLEIDMSIAGLLCMRDTPSEIHTYSNSSI